MENAGENQTALSTNGSLNGLPKEQPAGDLPFDAEKYKGFKEVSDLTEEQQVEFLQTLWSMMKAFVDLGFGVNSIQSFIPELVLNPSEPIVDPVELKDRKPTQEFEIVALDMAAEGGDS